MALFAGRERAGASSLAPSRKTPPARASAAPRPCLPRLPGSKKYSPGQPAPLLLDDGAVAPANIRNFEHESADMQRIDFQLDRDHVELNQLLKLTGLCDSGGAGKALVASGAVSVDGVVELRKTCKIRPAQVVMIDDVEIHVMGDVSGIGA